VDVTDAIPHDEGAAIATPCRWGEPPAPALASVTAAWQAILRVRHPEYTGLVVEAISAGASVADGSVDASAPDAGSSDPNVAAATALIRDAA
jgi:hypothetical protein